MSPAIFHPCADDNGHPVPIHKPCESSDSALWPTAGASLCFTPGGGVPESINGIGIAPWADVPTTLDGWAAVPGQVEMDEPPLVRVKGKNVSAGCAIIEPDGRLWLACPTNQFAGHEATFPKGRVEPGLSLQATAIKETLEETGLQVEIVILLGDQERSTTVTRFYLARRIGGSPAAVGWESQAVRLVPLGPLAKALLTPLDQHILGWSEEAAHLV